MTSEALSREELLARKTKVQKPHPVELPSGGCVLMRVPIGKDYREWKKYLRDEKGDAIESRLAVSDELLVASILVNPDGTPMFTREDVVNMAMDEIIQPDLEHMKVMAYELYGQRSGAKIILDEDREKNS